MEAEIESPFPHEFLSIHAYMYEVQLRMYYINAGYINVRGGLLQVGHTYKITLDYYSQRKISSKEYINFSAALLVQGLAGAI